MKKRDAIARAIYSVLISKIDLIRITKRENKQDLTDADCVAVIQKTLKELEDEQDNFKKVNNQEKVNSIEKQMEYGFSRERREGWKGTAGEKAMHPARQ